MSGRAAHPLVALLLLCGTARADSGAAGSAPYASQRTVTGAVRLGANFAHMSGDADVDLFGTPLSHSPEAAERLCVGGSLVLGFTPRWGARIDALYAVKGGSASQLLGGMGESTGAYTFDYDMRYLQLPLLATFTFPYDGEFVPHLFAGPELAFLLSSEVDGEGSFTDENAETQEFSDALDISDDTATFDLAITVGAGIKMPLARGRLVLDVRYAVSLTKAVASAETVPYQGITLRSRNLRHRAMVLTAGYEF